MKIINLTPHPVNFYRVDDLLELGKPGSNQYTLPEEREVQPFLSLPSHVTPATAPRVEVNHVPAGAVAGVPLFRAAFGEVYNLPASEADTVYIVSALVFNAAPARQDLVTVLGGVKDRDGRICGCVGLAGRRDGSK